MFGITPSARLRPSPFYEATLAEGVAAFTTYNHMLMPTSYGSPDEEYWRLLNGVSQWDVACERQVELKGRDAGRLAQILCPRDLRRCEVGQGKYVPLCNHAGFLINDPILLKLDEDHYWLSIADSNIWFWARAIAAERGLEVEVSEPDVSPLAVQGPKAEEVVASMFGEWVRGFKYFWFREAALEGIPLVVARSGWSKQGGFELYLMDGTQGTKLWNIVKRGRQALGHRARQPGLLRARGKRPAVLRRRYRRCHQSRSRCGSASTSTFDRARRGDRTSRRCAAFTPGDSSAISLGWCSKATSPRPSAFTGTPSARWRQGGGSHQLRLVLPLEEEHRICPDLDRMPTGGCRRGGQGRTRAGGHPVPAAVPLN